MQKKTKTRWKTKPKDSCVLLVKEFNKFCSEFANDKTKFVSRLKEKSEDEKTLAMRAQFT